MATCSINLPGKFYGQRSLAGYSPWGHKELDTTEPQGELVMTIVKMKVTQSCPTLCDPMYYTVHGVLQARILEWVAFPFSGYLPNPGIEPGLPHSRILYQLSHKESNDNTSNFNKSLHLLGLQFSLVAQSCLTLCDRMNRSSPGLPVHHQLRVPPNPCPLSW